MQDLCSISDRGQIDSKLLTGQSGTCIVRATHQTHHRDIFVLTDITDIALSRIDNSNLRKAILNAYKVGRPISTFSI